VASSRFDQLGSRPAIKPALFPRIELPPLRRDAFPAASGASSSNSQLFCSNPQIPPRRSLSSRPKARRMACPIERCISPFSAPQAHFCSSAPLVHHSEAHLLVFVGSSPPAISHQQDRFPPTPGTSLYSRVHLLFSSELMAPRSPNHPRHVSSLILLLFSRQGFAEEIF